MAPVKVTVVNGTDLAFRALTVVLGATPDDDQTALTAVLETVAPAAAGGAPAGAPAGGTGVFITPHESKIVRNERTRAAVGRCTAAPRLTR